MVEIIGELSKRLGLEEDRFGDGNREAGGRGGSREA